MLAVDSDTLYILATGISIVLIVLVVLAKYWFGKSDRDEEENDETTGENEEEVQDELGKGAFGRLPIGEWQQHKKALEREYRERFMDSPPFSPKGDSEKAPLLPRSATENDKEPADTKVSARKAIHIQDDVGERRADDENEGLNLDTEEGRTILDEDLKGILSEKMDETELAHLPGQLKSVRLRNATKELEAGLTDEQKQEEARVRNQQLETILTLMRQQEEKFGTSSMEEIEEQLKLYNL